jgi:hypothetical protein
MKKSPLIGALMLTLLAVSVRAADMSGVWSLRLLTSDGESAPRATVALKQDGEKLTGKCVIDQTDQELTVAGQVTSDNTLTWRCVGEGSFEASFKATIDSTGRQMTGEWATNALAQGTFKGSRPPK